ncbi:MAG: ankyrin repeat domain-containing protein, partial [Acidimicrobiales bacterium]|nr:ankyrin repeat domain-containing protein [Acidimicrobiales bacterium]
MTVLRTGELSVLVGLVLLVGVLASFQVAAAAEDVPLIEAVKAGDSAAVSTLLGTGTDVDAAQPDGATALHWAVFRDYVEIAGLLIDAGADVNAANELGATALWLA